MEILDFIEGTENTYDIIIDDLIVSATDSSSLLFSVPDNFERTTIFTIESVDDDTKNVTFTYNNNEYYLNNKLFATDPRHKWDDFDYNSKSDYFNCENFCLGIKSNIDGEALDVQTYPNIWSLNLMGRYKYHLYFKKGVRLFAIYIGDINGVNTDSNCTRVIKPARNDDGTLGLYNILTKKFYPIKTDVLVKLDETIYKHYVLSPDEVSKFDNTYYDDVRAKDSTQTSILTIPEGKVTSLEIPEGKVTSLEIPEGKVTSLEIPEGKVTKIQDSDDNVLWSKS